MKKYFLTCLFIILLVIVGVYLTAKAKYENSWDGWGFGSAQTMLSTKYWVEDGWASHYFLFIPTGYSKITRYFDNPKLNQHAWVDVTGSPGQKRVYYTHYPSGYLFFPAFLMEIGFKDRFWFRFFEILVSLASLILLYKFFQLIAPQIAAFSAVIFYMLSTPFLNFADSLAGFPLDDFFRFLILVLSLSAVGSYWIWLTYFIASLVSYDYTIFTFIWLTGLEIIIGWNQVENETKSLTKKLIRIFLVKGKKIILFASAPILAFIIQIIQNSWYLGFHNAFSDLFAAFLKIGIASHSVHGFIQQHFLQGILYPLTEAFAFPFRSRYLLIFIIVLIISLFLIKKNKLINNSTPYLFLLGIAALTQTLVILDNHPYKGRVLGVFAALLIGIFIYLIIQYRARISIWFLISLTIFMFFLQTKRTMTYIEKWPNNTYDSQKIEFAQKIKNILQPFHLQDIAIFSMFPTAVENTYYDMYYFDAPILYFNDISDLIRDFIYLKQISKYPFSTAIITENKNQIDDLVKILGDKASTKTFSIQGKDILLIF